MPATVRTKQLLAEEGANPATITAAKTFSGAVTFTSTVTRASQVYSIAAGAKVGTTAGCVVAAADNKNSLARCPASQTAATLVVPITGLRVGWIITGYYLVGQIESGGNTATVDAAMRKQTTAAADLTDGAVTNGAITQVSVTADTIISSANAGVTGVSDTIGADETFYVLITITTAASTDVDLQAVNVIVTEA